MRVISWKPVILDSWSASRSIRPAATWLPNMPDRRSSTALCPLIPRVSKFAIRSATKARGSFMNLSVPFTPPGFTRPLSSKPSALMRPAAFHSGSDFSLIRPWTMAE